MNRVCIDCMTISCQISVVKKIYLKNRFMKNRITFYRIAIKLKAVTIFHGVTI